MPLLRVSTGGYRWVPVRPNSLSVQGFPGVVLNGVVDAVWFGLSEDESQEQRQARAEGSVEWALVPTGEGTPRTYDPLADEIALCRPFAELRGGTDYLRFADAYGPLGVDPAALEDAGLFGEPMSLWQDCVTKVWRVLNAWDQLQQAMKDIQAKQRVLVAHKSEWRNRRLDEQARLHQELETAKAALVNVKRWTGDLSELTATVTTETRKHLGLALTFDSDTRGVRVVYQPETLLGVIWLQVMWVLTRQRDYRCCAWRLCGKWLTVGSAGKRGNSPRQRAHSRWCRGARCRAAHHQDRVLEVGKRRRQGESVAEIATALGEPSEVVTRFLQSYEKGLEKKRQAYKARRRTISKPAISRR